MTKEQLLDRSLGCIIGGAAGDALGYEVEFLSLAQIRARYAGGRIERYSAVPAHFSDDTQMTLFTAECMVNAQERDYIAHIRKAYLDWFATQTETMHSIDGSALAENAGLWHRRSPGNTCMTALSGINRGVEVHNFSKGCGGVMHVAPIGLYAAAHPDRLSVTDAGIVAALAAEITHLHKASSLASAMMAMFVAEFATANMRNIADIVDVIVNCLHSTLRTIPCDNEISSEFKRLILDALRLSMAVTPDEEAIRSLGEGWVGDEALAIALYCVARHFDDFEKCIVAAANHDGDSDSTAAIAGNLLGALRGISAIPSHYIEGLEMTDVLTSMAQKLVD